MPIEHTLRVAGFVFAAVIFYHLVRVQDVGSYLAAPFDFFKLTLQLGNFITAFLLLNLKQPGTQYFKRAFPVL